MPENNRFPKSDSEFGTIKRKSGSVIHFDGNGAQIVSGRLRSFVVSNLNQPLQSCPLCGTSRLIACLGSSDESQLGRSPLTSPAKSSG